MVNLAELAECIIDGRADDARCLTQAALAGGVAPGDVLDRGLLAGMDVVGQRFRATQMFLPDVLASARAMTAGMSLLEPRLAACGIQPLGRIVIGTVKGDIHDIGKNLVGILLRGAGFEVIDLGTNATAARFLTAVAQHQPDIVAMSAMLTTTMTQMKSNIDALCHAGALARTRVLIGGAPVTAQYAAEIGADAYAKDAGAAVVRARELLQQARAAGAGA